MMTRKTGLKLKRLLDIVGALSLLILLSPIMLIIAAFVWFNFGAPVIYSDPRVGRNASVFRTYKFRSMRNAFDANGKPLPDAQRMTRFSHAFRLTSLDELPQLWNVLKGEMSLIGPRPIITDYLPYVRGPELKRLEMAPGISGLSQVNGRNCLDWDARLEMDVWYVENWSLWLDIKVAFKTLPVWFFGQGVATPGLVTSARLDDVRRHECPRGAELVQDIAKAS